MDGITIRRVNIDDIVLLQSVSQRTFLETFAVDNTEDDMLNYLDSAFSLRKLKEELENPASQFWFAETASQIAGYIKVNFTPAQSDINDEKSMELERIYVYKEFLGSKVGQALFGKALEIAKSARSEYIWLGVWEKNPRAIRFYNKNGFVEFNRHVFRLGDDLQTDILMKMDLIH